MLDYQRIVDDVRSSLYSHGADAIDFLRATAADYSVACDEVNERLRQCGSLLRQGLRSEAIQASEVEPNVLDVVTLLDFPELAAWTEMANHCGIAPPPPLMLDVAADLNQAYALEQPLSALLQRHRLLALARAPLSARIQVLRRLAELDVNNAIWQEDLQVFENERQKQIRAEVEKATRTGDTAALATLDVELSSPDWKTPLPPDLARSASEAQTRLYYWSVQRELDQLATELASAQTGFHVEQARTLRNRWNEIIAASNWQPQEQIASRAAPALNWLDEQDEIDRRRQEHEAAVEALHGAAGHGQSAVELQQLYRRAKSFGSLPADLEERYQARLAVLERAGRRRRVLQISAAVIGAVVALSAIGMIVAYVRHEQKVTEFSHTLSDMIEHHQFDQAEALVRDAPSSVKQDPRVQESLASWEEAKKKEEIRRREFAGRLSDATYKLAEVRKSLANESGQTVLNRLYDELDGIQKELDHARALTQTEEDRVGLAHATDSKSQVKDQWQQQIDKTFLSHYDAFDKQLTQIENEKYSDFETRKAKVSDCKESIQKWDAAGEHVSPALLSRTNTLGERIAALEKGVHEGEQEERDTKQITAALGDIPGYVKALQEYSERNPHTDRAADFKRTIEESLCWQAIADWNKVAHQWRETGIVGLHPAAAQEQLAGAKAVSDTFADCPECASLLELLPYVRAVAARDNGGERIEVPLKKLFADRLVADVWMVEMNDGRRYYIGVKPALPLLQYIVDFEGKTRGRALTPLESQQVKSVELAPQVAVAKQVQPMLKALNDDNWEPSFCDMMTVIHADRTLDPILKTNLLKKVLEAGVGGSYCLEKAFGRHLEWFKAAKIDASANWLDPKDAGAAEARAEAAKKLADFPDVDEPRNLVKQDLAAIQQRKLTEYLWMGWLHRGQDGSWQCPMNRVPERSGALVVVYRQSPGGKPLLAAVGRFDYDRRTPSIHAQKESVLVEGRPVYLASP